MSNIYLLILLNIAKKKKHKQLQGFDYTSLNVLQTFLTVAILIF